MAEWSKAHAWKVCIRQRIEGSNPSLSATKQQETRKLYGLAGFFISSGIHQDSFTSTIFGDRIENSMIYDLLSQRATGNFVLAL